MSDAAADKPGIQLCFRARWSVLQKLRAIYIRNGFDLGIRLKEGQVRQQLCDA
jgi:hypothetical protein